MICLTFPLVRWGLGTPLAELLTERGFSNIVFAGFLTVPLRFICTAPTYMMFWLTAALVVTLLNRKELYASIPTYARLAISLISLMGMIVIEGVQPSTPHQGLMTLAENTVRFVKELRDPPPLFRYVNYPAKPIPVKKPIVIPPLVFMPMLPDPSPAAALTYYRNVESAFYARKGRFGTLYELGNHGAAFKTPAGYLMVEIDQDEIGQPLNRAEKAGLCVYPVEASAEKRALFILADMRAHDWAAGWQHWEMSSIDHRRHVNRWPARQSAAAAPPPDITPKIITTRARLSKLSVTLRLFYREQHRVPTPAEALEKFPMLSHGELSTGDLLDGWGRPFSFESRPVLRAVSAGPDGQLKTKDDIEALIDPD